MSVSKQELINELAKELKPLLKKPEWADFVKTGVHKERPPADSDWWYARGASVLLKVDKLGPIGVSKLRTKYGGRKNMGAAPEKFFKGSGSIVRKLLQQLETVGLLKQEKRGKYKGRVLTPKAHSLIAQLSKKLEKIRPKPEKPKPAPKEHAKEYPKEHPNKEQTPKEHAKEELKEAKAKEKQEKPEEVTEAKIEAKKEKENVKVQAKSKEEKAD